MNNISPKQIDLLQKYVHLLSKRNAEINLISRNVEFGIDDTFFGECDTFLSLQKKIIESNSNNDYVAYHEFVELLEGKYPATSIMYHILNCIQLVNFLDSGNRIADIGSGNGMPGILLNILGFEEMTLIETSQKKCGFLQSVILELSLSASVINKPIQECRNQEFDTLVSRAFSSGVSIFTAIKNIEYKDFYTLKEHDFDCSDLTRKSRGSKGFSFYAFGSDIICIKSFR